MAIAVLNELQDRLRLAAVAGISVLGEDFRLKRAVEQMAPLAASAPVLKKVYEQANALLDPAIPDKEAALLDALTLTDAVVCTQAAAGVEGELSPLPCGGGANAQAFCRYSDLEPLLTALTAKGSGRYEVVNEAYRQKSPALKDFRLKSALLTALGDSYSEMADLVQKILALEGKAAVPVLKRSFAPGGGRDMARRLQLIEQALGSEENEFYESLLRSEETSPVVREEAIRALGCAAFEDGPLAASNTDRLIALAVTEKGNLKKTALCVLGRMNTEKALEYWEKALKKAPSMSQYLTVNGSDSVSNRIAEQLDTLISGLLLAEKGAVIGKADADELARLLLALPNKCSDSLLAVLERIAQNIGHLSSLRGENKIPLLSPYINNYRTPDLDPDLTRVLNDRLIAGMALSKRPELIQRIKDLAKRTGFVFAASGLCAWLLSDPEHAFDAMQSWGNNPKGAENLLFCFLKIRVMDGFYGFSCRLDEIPGEPQVKFFPIGSRLDPRWIEALTTTKQNLFHQYFDRSPFKTGNGNLLIQLLNEEDTENHPLLCNYFYREARVGHNPNFLHALKTCGWTDFKGLIPKYFANQHRFNYYQMVSLYREVPLSPRDTLEELEQIASMIERGAIRSEYKTEFQRVRDYAENLKKQLEEASLS